MFLINIIDIFELIGIIAAAIGSILALFVTVKQLFPALFKIAKNKDFAKIKEIADTAMKEAEKSDKHGLQKQEMVVNIVKEECKLLDIDFDDQALLDLIAYIEQSINWFNDMKRK